MDEEDFKTKQQSYKDDNIVQPIQILELNAISKTNA